MKKYVILDFNGTIIDDVDLCLELLNQFLIGQQKPVVSMKRYKEIFDFPIRDYYIAAGIDLKLQSFDYLADIYNKVYMQRSKECKLYPEVIELLKLLKQNHISIIVLSATMQENLEHQLKYYGIYDYFDAVIGSDNYKGEGKIQRGLDYMNAHHINKDEVICVGDTTHDHMVASSLGCDCVLYSKGHMSKKRLMDTKREVVDNLLEINKYI